MSSTCQVIKVTISTTRGDMVHRYTFSRPATPDEYEGFLGQVVQPIRLALSGQGGYIQLRHPITVYSANHLIFAKFESDDMDDQGMGFLHSLETQDGDRP